MPLDVLITTNRLQQDPTGRELIEHLRHQANILQLQEAALYYDFPTYADYETVTHKPDALLVSPRHGVLAIRFVDAEAGDGLPSIVHDVDESLTQFCSILIGRMLKSRPLRSGMSKLIVEVTPVVYAMHVAPGFFEPDIESRLVTSLAGLDELLGELISDEISPTAFAEARSVVEGAKALTRAKPRSVSNPATQPLAASLSELESEIANFDQRQRRVALVNVSGPQRIRGLAGSGKTVILAMKAAHLHLTRPDEQILITFYTRSLRTALTNLVTRFYRHYRDEDPNWDKIHIRHGWGGARSSGTYADACRRENLSPLAFADARNGAAYALMRTKVRLDPFDFACRDLMQQTQVQPYYDHILIDEGQDFPSGFYELCFHLARGERDQKNIIWAYDELQNILDVTIRTPDQLFGQDADGQPRISLERSAAGLPPGAANDHVLSKCYRNQGEVLVTAHALGFGLYSEEPVQLLESKEHWEDVGYVVETAGEFVVGQQVQLLRPPENSPLSLDQAAGTPLIESFVAPGVEAEVTWVLQSIQGFLNGGLRPEDIIVIALDDRASRDYFRRVSVGLAQAGIYSNNIIADPYNEPAFTLPDHVTLSTVYRAKGNEAAVVLAIGVHGVSLRTRSGRNKLFTAFTRAKGWLRISGVGPTAGVVQHEVALALENYPHLRFRMPDMERVETIQRDLSKRSVKAKKIRAEYVKKLSDIGLSEDEVADLLSLESGYDAE
jgi:superfamily I DNA and RNA helicase